MPKYLHPCSLSEILQLLKTGDLLPEELIDLLCDRIEISDAVIRAFLPEEKRRERLQSQLRALKLRWPHPEKRPLLFGVPIGVKDIFCVDGFLTQGGSQLPPHLFHDKQAPVVSQLQSVGALILGKTVTTEFAYFQPGPTKNPHNIKHTPGGSSSGSAAAVAAGMCPLALGTQTIGSISRPASFCGTWGMKPSFGQLSRAGIIPFSPAVDQVGFFTQDVAGLQLVWQVLSGKDSREAEAINLPRLGVPSQKYLEQAEAETLKQFQVILEKLSKIGYEIIYTDLWDDIAEVNYLHRALNAREFATVHQKWYQDYQQLYHQKTRQLIESGQQISKELYQKALAGRKLWRQKLAAISEKKQIKIWLSPAAPAAAPLGLDSTGDPIMNLPWTYCGVPTIAAPLGMLDDLPLGLQCAGLWGEDEELLQFVAKISVELG
ncbi:MAG: amidase [Candidatus Cloacimonadales bacterium]